MVWPQPTAAAHASERGHCQQAQLSAGVTAAPSTSTALSSVLAADALIPLLDEPLIRDQIVALGEHLPEGRPLGLRRLLAAVNHKHIANTARSSTVALNRCATALRGAVAAANVRLPLVESNPIRLAGGCRASQWERSQQ